MQLDHIGVFVRDLERARAFYEGVLGLELAARSEDEAFRIWTFRHGAFEVHLFEPKKQGDPRIDHVAVRVSREELDEKIKELRGKEISFSGPHRFEGTTFVKVRDPDGSVFEWTALDDDSKIG